MQRKVNLGNDNEPVLALRFNWCSLAFCPTPLIRCGNEDTVAAVASLKEMQQEQDAQHATWQHHIRCNDPQKLCNLRVSCEACR
jgi:hypothetical protein